MYQWSSNQQISHSTFYICIRFLGNATPSFHRSRHSFISSKAPYLSPNRETKHKKYESSDGCASVSSLTPDPVLDSYPSKVDKPVASIAQDPGKDSEQGNTSTTSSDKENKKISRRFKLKSKDVSR